jgi:hypothetical protein
MKASKQTRSRKRSALASPPAVSVDYNQGMARFCTTLKFFRICGKPRCRRERACCGDAPACFQRHWAVLPDAFKLRLRLAFDFYRNGMSPREAGRAADAEYARRFAGADEGRDGAARAHIPARTIAG